MWLRWWDALEWGLARLFPRFWERVCIGARTYGQKIARMRKELPNSLWFDVVLAVWLLVVVRHIEKMSSAYHSSGSRSGVSGGSQGQQVGRGHSGAGSSSGTNRQARKGAISGQQKNKAGQRNQPKRKQHAH